MWNQIHAWLGLVMLWGFIQPIGASQMHIKVYTLSDPLVVPLPSPPNCLQTSHPNFHPIPVTATLWKISLGEPLGYAFLYRRARVVTSCSTNWIGMRTMSMKSQTPLATWATHVLTNSVTLVDSENEKDMTEDAAYQCKWNSDVDHTTDRLYVTKVPVYMAYGGKLVANEVEWEMTTEPKIWSNRNEKLYLLFDYKESCAFQSFKKVEGFLTLASNHSFVFLGAADHLRLVLDNRRKSFGCTSMKDHLYPTDVGIPVSLNITDLKFNEKSSSGLAMVSPPSDAVFKADILFEYDALVKKINENFETLDKHLCMERRMQWANAIKSGDPHQLAQFVSRDAFAQGLIQEGELHIRVRTQLSWKIKVSDTYIGLNGSIQLHYLGCIHSVDSASGILNFTSPNSHMLPPLLELQEGGYYDLRAKATAHLNKGRWLHKEVSLTEIEGLTPEGAHPGNDGIWKVTDTRSYSYEGFWSSWQHAAHVLGLTLLLVIGFGLMIFLCLGRICAVVSRYPRWFRRSSNPPNQIVIELPLRSPSPEPEPLPTPESPPPSASTHRRGSNPDNRRSRSRSRSPRYSGWERKYQNRF